MGNQIMNEAFEKILFSCNNKKVRTIINSLGLISLNIKKPKNI